MHLRWIENLLDDLWSIKELPKTVFEIAGFPHWETVNSNVYAFFLQPYEEHGLGRMFFDGLLATIKDEMENEEFNLLEFETEFEVEREASNIDILITSSSDPSESKEKKHWAIIIENKIHADLYNDLEQYWKSVKAEDKIGVVLSLEQGHKDKLTELKQNDIHFVNITHRALLKQVVQKMDGYFSQANEKYLLLLKDFIQQIEKYNEMEHHAEQYLANLKKINDKAEEIQELDELRNQTKSHVIKELHKVFHEYHFHLQNTNVSREKFIYGNRSPYGEDFPFRFWIYVDDIIYKGKLRIYFELFNEFTQYSESVIHQLKEANVFEALDDIQLEEKKNERDFAHIALLEIKLDFDKSNTLRKLLEEQISKFFTPLSQSDKSLVGYSSKIYSEL